MSLTNRQTQILEYIRSVLRSAGLSPTYAEIQRQFGFKSAATVTSHLHLLERKGAIRRTGGSVRNIELVEKVLQRRIIDVPVFGTIPAGMPMEAFPEGDRCISVDADAIELPKGSRTFALEVRGDSMVGAGILDGDLVIMELAEPRDREIVAALIDGETTLKRFILQKGRPFLRAENAKYPDLIPARELVIQGVFRALIRINKSRA